MNARDKGKRGEREWAEVLRQAGFTARRGQQFSGGNESPDVVCEELNWLHFEVKRVESLNLGKAVEQAKRDGQGKVWAVAHRRNNQPWLVTIDASHYLAMILFYQQYKKTTKQHEQNI